MISLFQSSISKTWARTSPSLLRWYKNQSMRACAMCYVCVICMKIVLKLLRTRKERFCRRV